MKSEKLKVKSEKSKIKNAKLTSCFTLAAFFVLNFAFSIGAQAQENPPAPQAPKSVAIPAVKEKKLPNGLTVAVVERKNVPLITVQLLIKSGAGFEEREKAGLANMTAALLTKGTKTRNATQIAEQMEFLGGSIASGAGWNNSSVTISVMSDKLEPALAIMSDVALNPSFKQEEITLLKSQLQDGLAYNLKQPGFLSAYVASAYSFYEHPAGGTPSSIEKITRADIEEFYKDGYTASNAVLIFAGDITAAKANLLAARYFGKMRKPAPNQSNGDPPKELITAVDTTTMVPPVSSDGLFKRLLVVNLPASGQASVNYVKNLELGRVDYDEKDNTKTAEIFYPALVMNSVLGGGYSSRLNQEIRIRRGLSYGAGSNFAWRANASNFSTRTQTKDESAAEVAELVLAELKRLMDDSVPEVELTPRKLTLIGDFGRDLETTGGLAEAVAALYTYELPTGELNSHTQNVRAVGEAQIKQFAAANLKGGDIIIVGDYAKFRDDLAKRFPNAKIEVVEAEKLDLSKANLQK